MEHIPQIGISIPKKESWDKVTGRAKYNGDYISSDTLHARILTSTHAHAIIKSIDTSKAEKSKGVQAVITGEYFPVLTGSIIEDRPPIAKDKVRYFGEPVAVVIANTEQDASYATKLIDVEYEPLPIINSVQDAIREDSILIHEKLSQYHHPSLEANPKFNTNIAGSTKIRKGDVDEAFNNCYIVLEHNYSLPQSDHIAMETRNTTAEILPSGEVVINTSSQAPFAIKEELSKVFGLSKSKLIVRTPLVGGAFGGKATVQLEFIAYIASLAVGGRKVRIANTREQDMFSSPAKIGVDAKIKIGATEDGIIRALEATYLVDCGAYSDTGPRMAKAIASSCTGPYNIENVYCDAFALYTNHIYVTSYRGFGHVAATFPVERSIDKLAIALNMDPLELRLKNAIREGNTTPTQSKVTLSNTGNVEECINKLKTLINWEEGQVVQNIDGTIRAKGMACFWKTSNSAPDAISGVILKLNSDGGVDVNFGAVEIGPGMKTAICQIVAEKMKMDINKVHSFMEVDTQISPKHWKTVASMTTFMAGNAAIKACESIIKQLKSIGSIVLRCTPKDLDVANQKVFLRDDPSVFIHFKDLAHGYKYADGPSIGGEIIGHGNYIMKHLVPLNPETGQGKTGPSITVGAQAVEIEYDPVKYDYRLLKAATIIDAGKIINPGAAKGLLMGGMSMGLGLATREEFVYNAQGQLENSSLRTYKLIHFGEQPEYLVEFVETEQIDAPFGARGLAEHGIIGIPAALANAISIASQADFDTLPISPETIWKAKTGGKYDSL
jgi:CO/xanthine dehydrogenase Mo-binding subunit